MTMRMKTIVLAIMTAPLCASASHAGGYLAYAESSINVRSGPSIRYPAVGLLSAGREMTVHGCLRRYTWCDVSTRQMRGWVLARNIRAVSGGRRVYLSIQEPSLDIPIVTYSLRSYWDDYYRDQDFYGDLDRWSHYDWEGSGSDFDPPSSDFESGSGASPGQDFGPDDGPGPEPGHPDE